MFLFGMDYIFIPGSNFSSPPCGAASPPRTPLGCKAAMVKQIPPPLHNLSYRLFPNFPPPPYMPSLYTIQDSAFMQDQYWSGMKGGSRTVKREGRGHKLHVLGGGAK
nr:hypothetical protein [Morchella crassipes]